MILSRRHVLAPLLLCGLLLSLLPALQPQADAAPPRRAVTISSPAKVKAGALFTVRGHVSRTPAGSPVRIEVRTEGPWRFLARATTGRAGHFAHATRIDADEARQYRAIALPHRGRPQVASASTVTIADAAYQIRISAPGESPYADYFKIQGNVTGMPVGWPVILEKNPGTGWVYIGTAYVATGSTFSYSTAVRDVTVMQYRARTAKELTDPLVYSNVIAVKGVQ